MKSYITFTKKGLFIIVSLFICIGFICSEICAVSDADLNAKTNADRLVFIKKLRYNTLSDKPDTKIVYIPQKFYDVYENYNTLQQSSGYDLSLYKGCEVTIYTYKIKPPSGYEGDWVINLMVYKDKIIGGDVSSTALGGYMLPLKQVN